MANSPLDERDEVARAPPPTRARPTATANVTGGWLGRQRPCSQAARHVDSERRSAGDAAGMRGDEDAADSGTRPGASSTEG
jgi:hypothetical protein